ncbi:MAG TPA: hypothetical protein DIT28_15190, partial [Oxalobacteraceae bacterium]|nr:hypothetical protein [Oxalobacteraceae bacterium]
MASEITGLVATAFLEKLLPQRESRRLETKRVAGKMVTKALEAICAFANTDGGTLVLGVEDFDKAKGADRLIGIYENAEAVDELRRKLVTSILPAVDGIRFTRIACTLRDGSAGHVVAVQVPQSPKVHSIRDDGTWTRLDAGNREMTASEITDLSYRRGVISAESEPMAVPLELLDTEYWRSFAMQRGFMSGVLEDRLFRIGLAKRAGDKAAGELQAKLLPTRAAVLLFADEPGGLLAGVGARSDIRIFHYRGHQVEHGPVP